MKFLVAMLTVMIGLTAYAQDSTSEGVEAKAKEGWVEVKTPWSFSYVFDSWIGMNEVHNRTFGNYTQYHIFSTSYKLNDKRKISLSVPFIVSKKTKATAAPTAAPSTPTTPEVNLKPASASVGNAINMDDEARSYGLNPDHLGYDVPADIDDKEARSYGLNPDHLGYDVPRSTAASLAEAETTPKNKKSTITASEAMSIKDFTLSSAYIRYDDSSLFSIAGSDVSGSVRLYMPTGALVNESARESLPVQLRGNFGWSKELMPDLKFGVGLEPRFFRNLKGENTNENSMARFTATMSLSQSFDKFNLSLSPYTVHSWSYKKAPATTPAVNKGAPGTPSDERIDVRKTSHNFGLFLSGSYQTTDDVTVILGIDHSTPWKDIKFDTAQAQYNLAISVSM